MFHIKNIWWNHIYFATIEHYRQVWWTSPFVTPDKGTHKNRPEEVVDVGDMVDKAQNVLV